MKMFFVLRKEGGRMMTLSPLELLGETIPKYVTEAVRDALQKKIQKKVTKGKAAIEIKLDRKKIQKQLTAAAKANGKKLKADWINVFYLF